MISEYSEEESMNTIKGAIARYEDMIDKEKKGKILCLNRCRKDILKDKEVKITWANTWYLKGTLVGTLSL